MHAGWLVFKKSKWSHYLWVIVNHFFCPQNTFEIVFSTAKQYIPAKEGFVPHLYIHLPESVLISRNCVIVLLPEEGRRRHAQHAALQPSRVSLGDPAVLQLLHKMRRVLHLLLYWGHDLGYTAVPFQHQVARGRVVTKAVYVKWTPAIVSTRTWV